MAKAKTKKLDPVIIAVADGLDAQSERVNGAFSRIKEVDTKLRKEGAKYALLTIALTIYIGLTQVIPGAIYWVPRFGKAIFCDAPLFQRDSEKPATRGQLLSNIERIDNRINSLEYSGKWTDVWELPEGKQWYMYSDGRVLEYKDGEYKSAFFGTYTKDQVAASAAYVWDCHSPRKKK